LGSFTPQTCPDEYITAIQNLIQHYTYEIAHPLLFPNTGKIGNTIPLVVNTQGWVKGLGEELLRSIEIATSPSHLFTFESDQDEPAIQHNGNGGGWTSSPPPEFPNTYTHLNRPPIVHTLQSAPITPLLARHTPSDLRTLAMIAYFHSQLSTTTTTTWDFSTPLLAVAPYQVDLSPTGSLRKVYTSGEGSENIIPEDLALALNGNIIALIHETDQDPAIEDIYDPTQSPGLDETTFLGLALVRAIKFTEDGYILHLLTPVTGECLQRANAIIRNGAVELPLCGMLDWRAPNAPDLAGVKWEDTPYLDVSGVVGVGGERRRFRRNLMRKGM
jgi:polynucleotide 5'-hydroxyl-kinase GRC3/NOL9